MPATSIKRLVTTFALWSLLPWVTGGKGCGQPEEPFTAQQPYAADYGASLIKGWDFKYCDSAWISSDSVWECDRPTTGPRAGVEGSGNVLATDPDGYIPKNYDGHIASPVLDLSEHLSQPVFLSVSHWYDFTGWPTGPSRGGGRVEVLFDGDWLPVEPAGGYDGVIKAPGESLHDEQGFTNDGAPRTWRRSYFDVSPFLSDGFRFRFHAANKGGPHADGWYVDDIELWQGTFSLHMPETDLGACEPGTAVRFSFDACDEGWGVMGDRVWSCGPPTKDSDTGIVSGPETDSPAFDRDGSGNAFGTGLSGDLPRGSESALVSPVIGAAGCSGGNLWLGFWHWYHFGPGGGGFVQVYDGDEWVDVAPRSGYPGVVEGGMTSRSAYGHQAFVTRDDQPSGWRYDAIDFSAYTNDDLQVRFVVSTDAGAARPGWYVDSVEVVRDRTEALPPLIGVPGEPHCGLSPILLSGEQIDRNALRDPCKHGETILDWQYLPHDPPLPGYPTTYSLAVNPGEPGALCVVLANGTDRVKSASVVSRRSERVEAASVVVGSSEIIGAAEFGLRTASAKEIVPTAGGTTPLVIELEGEPGSNVELQVKFLPGAGMVTTNPGRQYNFMIGYHDEVRPQFPYPDQTEDARIYDFAFDVDAALPSYATRGVNSVIAYSVQIMDAETCETVKDIRGWQGYGGSGAKGYNLGPQQVRVRWDGRTETGDLVPLPRTLIVRATTIPCYMPAPPGPGDSPICDSSGDASSSLVEVAVGPLELHFYPATLVEDVKNAFDWALGNEFAGGEWLDFHLAFQASVAVSDVPDDWNWLVKFPFRCPTHDPDDCWDDWVEDTVGDGNGVFDFEDNVYPFIDDARDMANLMDLKTSSYYFPSVPWDDYFLTGEVGPDENPYTDVGISSWCGEDSWGYGLCEEIMLRVRVPQDEFFYRKDHDFTTLNYSHFYMSPMDLDRDEDPDEKDVISNLQTGIASAATYWTMPPTITEVSNDLPELGGKVRWQDSVEVSARHLHAYMINGTPPEFAVTLCLEGDQYGEDALVDLEAAEGGNLYPPAWQSLAHHGNKKLDMWEWPFATVDGKPQTTLLATRGYFAGTCDPTAQQVLDDCGVSGCLVGLTPPIIVDVEALDVSSDKILTMSYEGFEIAPWYNDEVVFDNGEDLRHYLDGEFLWVDLENVEHDQFFPDALIILDEKAQLTIPSFYDDFDIKYYLSGTTDFWDDLVGSIPELAVAPPFFPYKLEYDFGIDTYEIYMSPFGAFVPSICPDWSNCVQWTAPVPAVPWEVPYVAAHAAYHYTQLCMGTGVDVIPRGFLRDTGVPVEGDPVFHITTTACTVNDDCDEGVFPFCGGGVCRYLEVDPAIGWLEPGYSPAWCFPECLDADPFDEISCFPRTSSELGMTFDYTALADPQIALWWYDPDDDGLLPMWQARLKFAVE